MPNMPNVLPQCAYHQNQNQDFTPLELAFRRDGGMIAHLAFMEME